MLDIQNLRLSFLDRDGDREVLHGVRLHMEPGERLGLVGESGSGKSVTALTIAGLLPRNTRVSGTMLFRGRDLLQCTAQERRAVLGTEIGMVFQEPMTSLDPLMKVGPQVEEALRLHERKSSAQRRALALELMEQVGLSDPARLYDKYPHQISGGQRQRAMIAAALIHNPALLLADEPTTALDVTVQAQILELLRDINAQRGIGILFISHDLHVIRKLCTRVAVMHGGIIVESGPVEQIFADPKEDYTKRLLAAIPTREKRKR